LYRNILREHGRRVNQPKLIRDAVTKRSAKAIRGWRKRNRPQGANPSDAAVVVDHVSTRSWVPEVKGWSHSLASGRQSTDRLL
jgi:hypothetical protein